MSVVAEDAGALTVLVVDDESGMRAGMRRALRGLTVEGGDRTCALEVEEAADGRQALDRLAKGGVDILLLDHGMPEVTGLEVLEELRRSESETLAVMVTAYATLEMAVQATKEGAYDFLAKPFTPAELRETVLKAARHLAASRAAKRLTAEKRRVRFEFLSVLAHELKAPLGAVEGYLRLLQEGVVDDDPKTLAHVVDRSLARLDGMRKLIFDLLDLTRIESGHKVREVSDVDLVEAAGRAVETFQPLAAERGIEVTLEAPDTAVLQSDSGEMEIVLNNLVSNAVKYNRDGGRVTVRVTEEPERLRLDVADTGIGMDEDEVDRLFGEFVRIKNDKTRGIEGSGLGLSILRRLARLNGGDVTVASVPDEGTTFTVTLARNGVPQE